MRSLTVDLAALDLDLHNPRVNATSNQTEALASVLQAESIGDRVGEKVFNLAKSICELGSTDPSERLIVIDNPDAPGRYIVLDGNRRVTALKLLTEPTLLEREDIGLPPSLKRRLHALRNEYDVREIATRVDVSLAASRDEAHPFISLKHTGEVDGAGRSAWSALQQARFEDSGTYKLLMRLRVDQLLNAQALDQLDSSQFAVSTFERAAASSEFSNKLGGRLSIDSYDEGLNPALSLFGWARVANDTANGDITSRTLPRTEEVAAYLERIRQEFQADQGNDDEADANDHPNANAPHAPPSSNGANGQGNASPVGPTTSPTSPTQPTARPRTPRTRHYLIDRRNSLQVTQQKCRKLHDELAGKVKVTEAPYACAFLARSLLELTAHHYLTHFGLPLSGNFTTKIGAMARDLMGQPRLADEPADRVTIGRALLGEAGAYEDLSDASHNVHVNLSPEHVRATWDSIEPALRLAWRRINRGGGQQPQGSAQ